MTDSNYPPAADAEALSAYLAGELAEPEAAAFEARLAAEPALARQADALADALVSLHAADDAELPAGFEQRLEQRLTTERRQMPADLGAFRARRNRSSAWLKIGTAAAVVAAAAVMTGGALRQLGLSGGGADSAETTVADDAAGGSEGADGDAVRQAQGYASSPEGALEDVAGPVIIDEQVVVADEDALRRRYRNLPEVADVLGLALQQARPLARRFTAAVDRRDVTMSESKLTAGSGAGQAADNSQSESPAPPADEGAVSGSGARAAAADRCLAGILADARAPLVPVRVETLRYEGAAAVSYVLVTATPGSQRLDRTEVWVVAPDDCATIVFQQY